VKNYENKINYVHLKGFFILDAIFDTLLLDFGMSEAQDVVISGSSAGTFFCSHNTCFFDRRYF